MRSAIVYLSTRCPECHRETKIPYTRLEIADLLYSSEPFRMYSACHDVSWIATEDDRRLLFALIKPGDVLLMPQQPARSTATEGSLEASSTSPPLPAPGSVIN